MHVKAPLERRAGICLLFQNQDRRARGLARRQGFLRLGRILQRKALVDGDFHRAGADHSEQIVGGVLKLFLIAHIMRQRRPGDEQRALAGKDGRARTDPPARRLLPYVTIDAARRQAIQPGRNVVLPMES